MTDRSPDAYDGSRLSELMEQAVSEVEPREALDTIRNRTKVTPMPARRPWSYAVGGAVVAVAAVAAVIAVAGDQLGLTSGDERPAAAAPHHRHHHRGSSTPGTAVTTTPAVEESGSASASPSTAPAQALTLAGYYLGPTPSGQYLFREFTRVEAADPLSGAVSLLTSSAQDPDYSTPWRPGDLQDARVDGDAIDVTVAAGRADRPAGMSGHDATEAVQQVVYTLQAAAQSRLPVRFSTPTVLGVDTSQPVANAPQLDVLSPASISTPAEGATVSGSFTADGVSSSFEATVPWQVRQGDKVVAQGSTTAEGWLDKLYPWKTDIDVSSLAPGTYTFVAMTDDPTGGTEGGGPVEDTRTITVR